MEGRALAEAKENSERRWALLSPALTGIIVGVVVGIGSLIAFALNMSRNINQPQARGAKRAILFLLGIALGVLIAVVNAIGLFFEWVKAPQISF